MSWSAVDWAFAADCRTAGERAVLVAMAWLACEDGLCTADRAEIAARAAVAVQTVQDVRARLVARGLMTRIGQPDGAAAHYRLALPEHRLVEHWLDPLPAEPDRRVA